MNLLNRLLAGYDVAEHQQQVPIVFYTGGYLSGEKEIIAEADKVLSGSAAMGFDLAKLLKEEADRESMAGEMQGKETRQTLNWQVMLTGAMNGLNPCGISMLLMVMSILVMTEKSFLKGCLAYMSAKFITYIGMGAGAFGIIAMVKESFLTEIDRWMTVILDRKEFVWQQRE